eukprot:923148_1
MECFAFIVYVRWTSCVIKFNDIEQDHTTFIGWVIASRLISLAQELRVCLWIILCRVCGGHLVQLRVDWYHVRTDWIYFYGIFCFAVNIVTRYTHKYSVQSVMIYCFYYMCICFI